MPTREEILISLSEALKKGKPIVLSTYEPEPPVRPMNVLYDATIKDILIRRDRGVPQIFSGVSYDLLPTDES